MKMTPAFKKYLFIIGAFLLGVLVIVICIIFFDFITSPPGNGYLQKSRAASTKTILNGISLELWKFQSDCGFLPSSQQGLRALISKPELNPICQNWKGPYGAIQLRDVWKTEFIYSSDGKSFTLKSLGRDKKVGGVGYDADIVVNSSQPPEPGNSK
jgi:general secretion pathway protein G